ncbi:MAG: glycosyltransferase family 4 protein, partial [Pseudomonadota bacterium]
AVGAEMTRLRAFGIDIASAPIWDLEGIGCGAVLPTCLSLHTTYALAHPSKPDWALRPIYRHAHVDRMIAAERRMLANAPMILANSAAIVGDIEEAYGVTLKGRYTVVHHGTADPGEGPVRDDGAPMMLFASRFEQRKGFDLALFAADRLLQRHPSARVVFAGDALDEERRALLEGLGLSRLTDTPRVDWAGKLSREALDGLMRRADVVLFPSRYESFGLVLIEAFAAGTPVIALDTPSAREVLGPTGKAGVLIEAGPGTPGQEPWITGGALGDAAVELLTHPQRLARMKASARERFQTAFTLEAMGAAGEAFFHRHLARVQGTKTAEGHAGGIGIKGVA